MKSGKTARKRSAGSRKRNTDRRKPGRIESGGRASTKRTEPRAARLTPRASPARRSTLNPQPSTAPKRLLEIYQALRNRFGHRNWWPGETPFEVCVGAILTQNTAWSNVEKAIANIKAAGLMDAKSLRAAGEARIAELIRPAGYFNVKARRLGSFLDFLIRGYGGSVEKLGEMGAPFAREALLDVHGIGKETADSIVLYALNLPMFVVDAYTKRALSRIGLVHPLAEYDDVQKFFMQSLPEDVPLYNDYHAQIVELGKNFCRKRNPKCEECPVVELCEHAKA